MRQTIHTILFVMATVLTAACTGSNDTKEAQQTDTSFNADFDHAISVADSLYNCMQFRDAYDIYQQLLDNQAIEADSKKKLYVLDALCYSSELAGHKAEQTKWLQQLLDLAIQTDNTYYHAMALMSMGQNVFYEGDREKGIQYVSKAVDLISEVDRPDADHLTHSSLIMLARLYAEMKDYDNALKTNERNLQLTMQGTHWGEAPNIQLIDRRMALAKMAALLAKMGNFQRADSAYAAWKAVQYEGNHTRDYFIVDYMKIRGRYQEAIPIYNDLIERVHQQGDTLGEMMNTAKWGLAEVYRKMGNCEQAATLYEEVLEIQDTLKSRKAKNTAQELAAIYHDKEQNQIIMQQEAENARQETIILIACIILIGVAALAVIVIFKNRAIRRKNLSLATQITEAMVYKEKYLQEKLENTVSPTEIKDLDTLSDEQLFHYINDIIVHERLFLNADFDRQTIMDRFNLSKERVGNAMSRGSQYTKLTEYTQELRLEYSTLLMSNHPDMNIAKIAEDCGFTSYSYFSKCFRKRFGMTPTEFRSSAEQSS